MKKRLIAMIAAIFMMIPLLGAAPVQAASADKGLTKLKSGTSVDLYKDGKKEKISYRFNNDHTKVTFTINGKKFTFKTNSDFEEELSAVYYGDIDKKDKFVDIFLQGYGPSETFWYVLRYDKKSLKQASVQHYDYYENKYFSIKNDNSIGGDRVLLDGKGNLKLRVDDDVLGGCFNYYAKYKLNSVAFQLKETKQKTVSCGEFLVGRAKKDFKIYKKASQKSGPITVYEGEHVKIVSTDLGIGWTKVKTLSGDTGYLYTYDDSGRVKPGKISGSGLNNNLPVWG